MRSSEPRHATFSASRHHDVDIGCGRAAFAVGCGPPDFGGTRYDLVEEIGRGGMGIVFRARDRELEREVAVKVASWPGAVDEERLQREAKVLAGLEHPGIVAIHEYGQLPDGRGYYAMRLVSGDRLADRIRRLPSLADRIRLFDRICDVVAFAHARGIVHRDLKPSNIMVGAFGEVSGARLGAGATSRSRDGRQECSGRCRLGY